jgi:hypothetical protein
MVRTHTGSTEYNLPHHLGDFDPSGVNAGQTIEQRRPRVCVRLKQQPCQIVPTSLKSGRAVHGPQRSGAYRSRNVDHGIVVLVAPNRGADADACTQGEPITEPAAIVVGRDWRVWNPEVCPLSAW